MKLSISPFSAVYQGVFEALVSSIPDTGFLIKAPVLVPYSDMKSTTFTVTANPGDVIDIYINDRLVRHLLAPEARFQVDIDLQPGYNFMRIQSPLEAFSMLVACTNYATLYGAWADQYFQEIGVTLSDMAINLNSRFSLKQVEHQILWQDLLPGTRMMRILAGKMAVKSLINMAPTNEGITDIAKALTGCTPIVIPTQLDLDIYEPECRLLYATAQDFAGYEFNIWLFNLCAASWQAFITLLNNLDDDIFKLLSVSDQKVLVQNSSGEIESHVYDMEASGCSIIDLLTKFLDCFSRVKVFVAPAILDEFSVCAYGYPFDLAVENPIGYIRFDSGIPFNQNPQVPFDSADPSDPYTDGLLGLSISCRFDSNNLLNSLDPQVVPGADCPPAIEEICSFKEPCASAAITSLLNAHPELQNQNAIFLGGSLGGLQNLWTTNVTTTLRRLAPLTQAVNGFLVLPNAAYGMAVAKDHLWVANGAVISRIDPATISSVANYAFGGGTGFRRLQLDPSVGVDGTMYGVGQNGSLNAVNVNTGATTTPVTGLSPLDGIRLYGRVFYLCSTSGDIMYAVDADTFTVLWTKAFPAATGPSDVILVNGSIWVACTNGTILELDPVTRVTLSSTAAGAGSSRFIYVGSVLQWWVTGAGNNSVRSFDPQPLAASTSVIYTLPAGANPVSTYCLGGQMVYTSNANGTVSAIDALNATTVTTAVAAGPAFDIIGTAS